MKHRNIKIYIIFIAILSILFLFNGCNKPEPPKILLSEDTWHYGEVTPNEWPTHDFIIKNNGKEKLIIESAHPSCPCVMLELTKKEIAAGEEAILKTTFDPTGYEGYVAKYITIKSNDPENPKKNIETTINVLRVPNPDIELSEQTFDLGTISREDITVIKFNISNTGDADLIIEEIISEKIFTHNLPIPLTIPPEEHIESEVYIKTNQFNKGEFRKAIRILTNDPQNMRVFIRIMGNIE